MPDKDDVARELATKHFMIEPGITRIFRITRSADGEFSSTEPIKLLEVNANTVPAGIMPLHFGPVPASGIPYPSVIVEVTPDEFERIKEHELKLPDGWSIGPELPKPADLVGA
jgi:hypothetical protein